jgi:hypothetical protein
LPEARTLDAGRTGATPLAKARHLTSRAREARIRRALLRTWVPVRRGSLGDALGLRPGELDAGASLPCGFPSQKYRATSPLLA